MSGKRNIAELLRPLRKRGVRFTRDGSCLLKSPRNITGEVVIPPCVTEIGKGAFFMCTELTGITIPDSVTAIGRSAFYDCSSLAEVTIPDGVRKIGACAFHGVPAVRVSAGNRYFRTDEAGALFSFRKKSILFLPPGFSGRYIIPGGTVKIEEEAFFGCTNLTAVTIPDGVKSIGEAAFAWCARLREALIPDSVTEIGECAFNGCRDLRNLQISGQVTEIRGWAFAGCSSLPFLALPDGVTKVASSALDGVPAVKVSEANSHFRTDGAGALFSIDDGSIIFLPCRFSGHYVLPEGTKKIGPGAFWACGLAEVTLPDGMTEVGDNAFYGCVEMTQVHIPGSVTKIGKNAFQHCDSLREIEIPDGVTKIGEGAFDGCLSLRKALIPKNVKLGPHAFPKRCKVVRRQG